MDLLVVKRIFYLLIDSLNQLWEIRSAIEDALPVLPRLPSKVSRQFYTEVGERLTKPAQCCFVQVPSAAPFGVVGWAVRLKVYAYIVSTEVFFSFLKKLLSDTDFEEVTQRQ